MTPKQFYASCRKLASMPHGDDEIDYIAEKSPQADFNPARAYGAKLAAQGFRLGVATRLYDTSHYRGDREAFMTGFFGTKACLHFVGMQDSRQYRNAVRQWGQPDYDWPTASFRILGECAPHDTVIFGASAFVTPKKHRPRTAHGK